MSDRNWSCKSLAFIGACVATAFLQGQEGAEELVCNGEVQMVSSCKVANSERKENKTLRKGRKSRLKGGGKGAKQRRELRGKREMEPESLQLRTNHSRLEVAHPALDAWPGLAWLRPPWLASLQSFSAPGQLCAL